MSLQKLYYRKDVGYDSSLVEPDVTRVVSYDEDGYEIISWLPVDYKLIIRSHGTVNDWNLDNLLKAGINPDFPVHTGLNSRLEGVDTLNSAISSINSVLDSVESPKSE